VHKINYNRKVDFVVNFRLRNCKTDFREILGNYMRGEKGLKNLIGKPGGKRSLGRPRRRL
jgi:hypothetical protein